MKRADDAIEPVSSRVELATFLFFIEAYAFTLLLARGMAACTKTKLYFSTLFFVAH